MSTPEHIQLFSDRPMILRAVLAVEVWDGFVGAPVSGIAGQGLAVWIGQYKPLRNLSGYFVFQDLPTGKFTLTASADYFFPLQMPLTVADVVKLGKSPLLTVTLTPSPGYPFPSGATLLRGMARNKQGMAVQGAVITAAGTDAVTQTAANGEFVLFFRKLTQDRLETNAETGQRFLLTNGGRKIKITANSPKGKASTELDALEAGVSSVLPVPLIIQ